MTALLLDTNAISILFNPSHQLHDKYLDIIRGTRAVSEGIAAGQ